MIPGKSDEIRSPEGSTVFMPTTCCRNTSESRAYLPIGNGTNSAHCTGMPISLRRSIATTRAPASAAPRAADDPAGPSPITRTSQDSGTVAITP